jgi:DNA-damage-inducible protein J
MKTAMIRARVEPDLKAEAEQILSELGITATAAITIYYRQIVLQRRLPFDVLLPNATTRKALNQAAAGKNLLSASNAEELFRRLE